MDPRLLEQTHQYYSYPLHDQLIHRKYLKSEVLYIHTEIETHVNTKIKILSQIIDWNEGTLNHHSFSVSETPRGVEMINTFSKTPEWIKES